MSLSIQSSDVCFKLLSLFCVQLSWQVQHVLVNTTIPPLGPYKPICIQNHYLYCASLQDDKRDYADYRYYLLHSFNLIDTCVTYSLFLAYLGQTVFFKSCLTLLMKLHLLCFSQWNYVLWISCFSVATYH